MRTFRELTSLRVHLDKVVYAPDLDAPEDRPHPFVYFITIENASSETITIRGRKWVLTDAEGRRTVVEADGVVGKHPCLRPGERFSYNSYHVVAGDCVAEGAYIAINEEGEPLVTRIPKFTLQIP